MPGNPLIGAPTYQAPEPAYEGSLWDLPARVLNSLVVKPATSALHMTRDAMQDPNWGYQADGAVDPLAVNQATGAAGFAMTGAAPAAMLETQGPGMVATAGARVPRPPKTPQRMVFPEYAKEYPPVGPPNLVKQAGTWKPGKNGGDPTGFSATSKQIDVVKAMAGKGDVPTRQAMADEGAKYWLEKQLTPEALEFQKARNIVMKDVDKDEFTPYFDPAKRENVDPLGYPVTGDTLTAKGGKAMPATDKTFNEWYQKYGDPKARDRLEGAFDEGMKEPEKTANWYFMKQLHDEFVDELGPVEGPAMFKERFAKSMATTTGGQNPTDNLMMAAYGNYKVARGADKSLNFPEPGRLPDEAYNMAFPVGGRYASTNAANFNAHIGKEIDPAANPKRFNFQNDYLGHDAATIDEQMMGMIDPGAKEPTWYAPAQQVVDELATQRGVTPKGYQDVAWAGGKAIAEKARGTFKGHGGPMIQTVNRMIERTSRLTGQTPKEVVRGFIRANRAMYSGGPGGAAFGAMPVAPEQAQPVPVEDPLAGVPDWLRT